MSEAEYNPAHDIDYEEVCRFLSVVYDPADCIEFRAIRQNRETGTVSCYLDQGRFIHDLPERIKVWLDSRHDERFSGIYVGVNPRRNRATYGPNQASSDSDVVAFRCGFADLDNCDPNAALALLKRQGLPDPTLIVHSGRSTGTHLYWRFTEPMSKETWEGVQRAIQNRLNGDTMKDAPRVMRLPGTYNFNRRNNARVLREGQRYDSYRDLGLSADEMLPPTFTVAAPGVEADERNLGWKTRKYLELDRLPEGGNEDWGGRNNALFSVACDFIANGFGYEETCDRLLPLAVDRDGLPEYEAKRTITNAVNRNPTRSLMVGVNGVDETWTKFAEWPQFANRPIPTGRAENFDEIGRIVPHVRQATDEEQIEFAILRGDIDLPRFPDPITETIDGSSTVDDTEDLTPEESERRRYEEELADLQQWELSAPPLLSNYSPGVLEATGPNQKDQAVKLYRDMDDILNDVRDGFDGWPKYAPGMGLFGYRPGGDTGDKIVHGLPTPASFFAFMKASGQVRWTNEPTVFKQGTVVRELRALKENEAFELMKERCPNRYSGFAQYPHQPAIDGFYYPDFELPEPSKNFEVLNQFLNALNPETETDRSLLLAALVTPAWGGPPGSRPLFVLASDHGQGAGKTETVKAISEVWGGYYPLSMEKTWADNAKAMMSSTDWLSRVCVWDNVKGRFSSGEIEGAVTESTIQGHRLYVGTVKRYNDVTFFVTLNNPDMSRDLAQRAVVIKLGAPKSGNFTEWWRTFLKENQRQLISDSLAVLSRPEISYNFGQHSDRWRAWQRGVLSRLPGIDLDETMNLIMSRREEVDSDTDEGAQIVRSICAFVGREYGPTGAEVIELSQVQIQSVVEASGYWQTDTRRSPAQNSKLLAQYVSNRTASLGILTKESRLYVDVNDQGTPVPRGSGVNRSPKWLLDWGAAVSTFGSQISAETFQSSRSPSDLAETDIPPI